MYLARVQGAEKERQETEERVPRPLCPCQSEAP